MSFNISTSRAVTLTFAALIFAAPVSATDSGGFISTTRLSAAQEVQDVVVDSDARGRANVRFSRDFSSARIRVSFGGLQGEVTRLHLHCNVAGANGPVAIGLIDTVAAGLDNSDVIFNTGDLISGTITNLQFPAEDPCPGVVGRPVNNIVSLAAAIDAGLIYWNLHTTAFPAGELRGQVRPIASYDGD